MAQSGWRLPPELLRRVRVRCAEEGVRQNAWVERALESSLRVPELDSLGLSPSPALLKAASEESMRQEFTDGALERVEKPKSRPRLPAGVKTARDLAMERQAALNKAKGS